MSSCFDCIHYRELYYRDDEGQDIEVGIYCLRFDDSIEGGDTRLTDCPDIKEDVSNGQ